MNTEKQDTLDSNKQCGMLCTLTYSYLWFKQEIDSPFFGQQKMNNKSQYIFDSSPHFFALQSD